MHILGFVKKQEVAKRLLEIIEEKFNGVVLQYSISAKMIQSTLQAYVEGRSLPGGENLAKLSKAGGVTTDWIFLGPNTMAEHANESSAVYEVPQYTLDEKEVIAEYRKSSDIGRKTGRMVFLMNPREQKKANHPLRRKTDLIARSAG